MRHTAKNLVIVASLIGAGFFAAYLRFRPYLGVEATYTDGQVTYDSLRDGIRYAVWDSPLPLSPTVNTDDVETRPAVSPDGLYLVFAGGQTGLNRDLYIAELIDGEPQSPQPLSLLNSPADDYAPAFDRDWLYFTSERAGGAGGADLYRASYRHGVFGIPEPLDTINTAEDECDPSPVPGSHQLAFAASRERGRGRDFDLFLATPTLGPNGAETYDVAPLDPVNSPFDEREPAFTRDGVTLLFASDREGGRGGFDLYRSVRERGTLLPPQPLDGVNTAGAERAPLPSEDGFALWFAADAVGSGLDLYRSRSLELFRIPGRPVGWLDLMILVGLLLLALLAFLARRWETLDVIYKCFLIALLLHLLLLWYFKRVTVEGDEIDLPGRDALFHVRVASASTQTGDRVERNGELGDLARQSMASAAPSRSQQSLGDDAPTQAPTHAVSRADRDADSTPARDAAADSLVDRAAPPTTQSDVALAQGESIDRQSGAAPTLDLGQPASAQASPRAAADSSRPTRATTVAAATNPATGAPAPASLDRGPRRDVRADAPSRADQAVAVGPSAASSPADAGPELHDGENVTPLSADAGSSPASTADLVGGSQRFERSARDSQGGPRRLTTSTASGAATPDNGAAAPPPSITLDAGQRARGDEAPSRTDATLAPTRSPGDAPNVALRDPGDERASGSPTATADAVTARDDVLLTPSWRGDARPRREVDAEPTRRTFAVNADLPAPVPSRRPLPEVARVDLTPPSTPEREMENTPYRNRFGSEKEKALQVHGGGAETEKAVADGLAYLASRQNEAGFWGSREDYEDKYGYVCIGKSALCLLAFLGAGHTATSNTEHSQVVERAIDFLLSVQLDEVGHFGWTSSYSHAISTYALAECYALTHDERLLAPLRRAVAWILRNQSDSRDPRIGGGWGYYNPDGPHFDRWSRVSVSSWQVMALESARLGGIEVPDEAFDRARAFLEGCYDPRLRAFRYNHDPSRLNSGYPTLPASTPAALFALSLTGADITQPDFRLARRYVMDRRPTEYRCRNEDAFVAVASGNLYFWYYGTLAMFRCGGEEWESWNTSMKDTLLDSQDRDGSWRNISPYADRARDTNRDRCYSTAMCVLSLEVYYRYFTPLLKVR